MHKYNIITYGCQMNESDSQKISTQLEDKEYKHVDSPEQADLVIVNACSVRQSAIDRVKSKIKQLNKLKRQNSKLKVILTGCILEKDKKEFENQVDEIWPITDFNKETKCQSYAKQNYVFVPIMTGCNNFCSYCAVPYTRGREKSKSAIKIIKEVKNLIKNGYKEIILLGQNVNSYKDKLTFPQLLQKLNDLPGNFELSFLTSHPKDMSNELIKVIAHGEKISKKIHLPIQSGDNQILKRMNRNYTIEHYKKLIKKIRKLIPNSEISTDIIVGFPGETEKQFQNTVKLVKETKFKKAFISSYSPRPGTSAFKIKDNIISNEKKRRKKIISNIFENKKKLNNKLIVILGPTASGKSNMAIKLAKKFNGEIISADSRQIYKGMNIGTAKIKKKEMKNIPHHLIDIIKPNEEFTLADFKEKAVKIIGDIQKRNKIPFLVGGTGLYIQAIVDNFQIPEVKPDKKLRLRLEKKTNQELYNQLKRIDPEALKIININNKIRIIRALEVCLSTKQKFSKQKIKKPALFNIIQIGLKKDYKILDKKISKRVDEMIENRLLNEVKSLIKEYGTKPYSMSGIGYKEAILYLKKEISLEQTKELINIHSKQYSRRQMSWFRRDKRIKWVKNYQEAKKLIQDFFF